MKKLTGWVIAAAVLMIGFPWLAVTFAGDAGMAICFILFFGINPLFSAAGGAFAGSDVQKLWTLPVITAGLFLLGTWIFFELGEPAFFLYGGIYLAVGLVAMLLSKFIRSRIRT